MNRTCPHDRKGGRAGLVGPGPGPRTAAAGLAFLIFLMVPALGLGSSPILFFSDLTSGPKTGWEGSATKGAAVTVWGIHLGSSGTLNVGGRSLSSADPNQVAEWGATTGNARLDARTTLERVTFWLDSSMSTGATTLTVSTGGVTSNALPFTVRDPGNNKIYFIATNGSDSNDGLAGTPGGGHGPWLHWYKADPSDNTSILAGDTIYIRGGVYGTPDGDFPSAIEWRTGGQTGTSTHPIAFVGYPGDGYPVSTIEMINVPRPSDGRTTQVNYVTLSKLQYTGRYSAQISWWGDGWRLIGLCFNNTSTAPLRAGSVNPVNCENTHIYGMRHVGGGWDYYAHVIYPNCGYWSEVRGDIRALHIAYCEIANFQGNHYPYGGAALNFRRSGPPAVINGVYIHHNYMHDSPYAQFFYAGEDGGETNYFLYNNLITNANQQGSGSAVACFFSGFGLDNGNFYAYNNTVFESGGAFAVFWGYNGADWHLKNNIIYESTGYKLASSGTGSSLYSDWDCLYGAGIETYYDGGGGGACAATEACADGSYFITNKIATDPHFVDPGGVDFRLQAVSACRDGGTTEVSPLITDDLLGIGRPQGGDYDIGAYEYEEEVP